MTPTYRDSGVSLDAAERSVARIGPAVRRTWNDRVVGKFGGFAAGIALPPGLNEPVAMMSSDGVGTKAEVARLTGLIDGLGSDLVAMCADDLAAVGATPIAMTDYLAIGVLEEDTVARLVESIASACETAGIALLGGETAEHPGVMAPDQFDLAGTALGILERGTEIDGSAIEAGDRIIGIASPNLRSNGFSLVRTTLLERFGLDDELPGTGRTVAEELLSPSVVYTPAIVRLISELRPHGLAHITGGGLPGNVARILPAGTVAMIDPTRWPVPRVFDAIRHEGVAEAEMFSTFNMGIGFVVVTTVEAAAATVAALETSGHAAWEIGEVASGESAVKIMGLA